MCEPISILTAIGTSIASTLGMSVAAAGASAAGAAVITGTTAAVMGGLAVGEVAMGLVGTALGVVGSVQSGNAQARMYGYQAQVNRQNAEIAKNNAAMERQAGLEDARRQRIKTMQIVGQQKVGVAAGGVDVGYGTPLDMFEDTATMGELDALMLEYDAEKKARNYEIEVNNFSNQANLDLFAARNAKSAGQMNAIATGVKGLGTAMSSFAGLAGGFNGLGGLGNGTKVSGGIKGDAIMLA
jgi:hypothetical protein